MDRCTIEAAFDLVGLSCGRAIGDPSTYRAIHPTSRYIHSARIFTREGPVWHGDLDLTRDGALLISVSNFLRRKLFVTPAQVQRTIPQKYLAQDAVAIVWRRRIRYFNWGRELPIPAGGHVWW